jgi:hypothetical protein
MAFEVTKKDNKTDLRFTHVGLVPEYECFGVCSSAWGLLYDGSIGVQRLGRLGVAWGRWTTASRTGRHIAVIVLTGFAGEVVIPALFSNDKRDPHWKQSGSRGHDSGDNGQSPEALC